MSLDPDLDSMRAQGHLAVDLLVDWLAELPRAPVARMPDARWLAQLVGEPLPTAPGSVEDSMRHFMTELMPFATLVNHPRFFAYIPCPGSYVGALGALLAAGTNLFTGSWLGGAVAAQLEEQVLEWVREALALPIGFRGVITSGGSLANLSGLAAARARVAEADWNRTTVYVSQATHHSVAKAARLLGITGDRVRNIPVDAGQRMVPEPLRAAIAADRLSGRVPMLVCGTLGTTTTGAIDPLDAMVEVCRAEGVWLHVDGAYGAAMALLPESRGALRALEAADSITLDPHKWLYAPFECGCFLTRHLDALRRAFAADGDYMQDIPPDEINMFQRGPELSRGNRALKLWLLIRAAGIDALRQAIRDDLALCRLAHDLLAADPRVRIVSPPQMSIFCFTLNAGEAAAQRLMRAVLDDGYLMLSSSRVAGEYVLRWCVLNHRTTAADIRNSVVRLSDLIDQHGG